MNAPKSRFEFEPSDAQLEILARRIVTGIIAAGGYYINFAPYPDDRGVVGEIVKVLRKESQS